MAGPARTITPVPRRTLATANPAISEHALTLAKLLDGKLNVFGEIELAASPATTTDIEDPRIGPNTRAWLCGIDQNGAASIPTISQAVVSPGVIRLTHAASALTRTLAYALFG